MSDINDFVIEDGVLIGYDGDSSDVVIPDSVISIGDFVFEGCKGLTSVKIPNSVTSISHFAFSDCSGLTSIEIPDSVSSIGIGAFEGCKGLTSIEIPDSVEDIGEDAFYGCNDNLVIITPADSYAEEYAEENEIKVKLI